MISSKQYPEHCVEWLGLRDKDGYGRVQAGGFRKAHRLMYTMFCGPIPEGMFVLHSCNNPACINPRHLRVGTALDNSRDVTAHVGHQPRSKLTDAQVQQIRSGKISYLEAEQRFGITQANFYKAKAGHSYRHLPMAGDK